MTSSLGPQQPPKLPGVCPYGFGAAPKPATAKVDSAPAAPTSNSSPGLAIATEAAAPSKCPVTRLRNFMSGSSPAAVKADKYDHLRGGAKPFTQQSSYAETVQIFEGPLGPKAAKAFPPDIAEVVDFIDAWSKRTATFLKNGADVSTFRNTYETGVAIADALRLVRLTNTKRIDDWLASPETSQESKAAFEAWRDACLKRTDALSQITSDALVTGNLVGWEQGTAKAAFININKLTKFMGSKGYLWQHPFQVMGLTAGLGGIFIRERQFLSAVIGEQMRRNNVPFTRMGEARMLERLNKMSGKAYLTERHAEVVRTAYKVLKERDVTGADAHQLIVKAMREGQRVSGKPWKGILRLTELVRYSQVDPKRADFGELFQTAMDTPIHYTHAPGAEWIVRDPVLGLKLLQMDGVIPEGQEVADLRQGHNSIIPGLFRAGIAKTKVAERYSRSLDAFLESMVVMEGADHKRHRKAFLPFFTQAAVLEHAPYVDGTLGKLLDDVEAKAARAGGAFDFKRDFAYHFPIRVICRMMGLPECDVPKVQAWAETSVRAMDLEAGMTLEISNAGQLAAKEFRAYLLEKLRDENATGMLAAVAKDTTLNEDEKIANLGVMIFAGFETTTGLLSKGMNELLQHPEQWQHLRNQLVGGPELTVDGKPVADHELRWLTWAVTQKRNVDEVRRDYLLGLIAKSPELGQRFEAFKLQEDALDNAVEELLRWNAPGSVIPLTCSRDVTVEMPFGMVLRGHLYEKGDKLTFKKGENINVPIDELNRRVPHTPGVFDSKGSGDFDISRPENKDHLSFGVRHQCIGATLAKVNAKRALEQVLRRLPSLTLDGRAMPQDMELFSGLAKLPVRIVTATVSGAAVASR